MSRSICVVRMARGGDCQWRRMHRQCRLSHPASDYILYLSVGFLLGWWCEEGERGGGHAASCCDCAVALAAVAAMHHPSLENSATTVASLVGQPIGCGSRERFLENTRAHTCSGSWASTSVFGGRLTYLHGLPPICHSPISPLISCPNTHTTTVWWQALQSK